MKNEVYFSQVALILFHTAAIHVAKRYLAPSTLRSQGFIIDLKQVKNPYCPSETLVSRIRLMTDSPSEDVYVITRLFIFAALRYQVIRFQMGTRPLHYSYFTVKSVLMTMFTTL